MDKQEKRLREELHEFTEQMKGILDKAKREGWELTKKEQEKFDALDEKSTPIVEKLRNKGVSVEDGRAAEPDNFNVFGNGNSQQT